MQHVPVSARSIARQRFTRCSIAIFQCLLAVVLISMTNCQIATTAFADASWTGGSGNWSDASNWAGQTVPALYDFVSIVNNDSINRTITDDIATPPLNFIYIDNTGGGTETFVMNTPGASMNTFYEGVGESSGPVGSGAFIQSAGTNTIQGNELNVGTGAGHVGTYTLTGTGVFSTYNEVVAYGGVGTFYQSGGTHAVHGNLDVGYSGTGTFALSSGPLNVTGVESVGSGGTGTFQQTGGTNSVFSNLFIGGEFNVSTGTYTLSAGSAPINGGIYIGGNATKALDRCSGVLSISGGQMTAKAAMQIWNTTSHLDVSAGTLTVPSCGNAATINITGGTVQLGSLSGGGTFNVSGGSQISLSSLQQFVVNISGTGSLKLTGGASNAITTLKMSGNGVLDLTNTKILVNYDSLFPASKIRTYLLNGYNAGKWNGIGISSSYAANLDALHSSLVFALGYADGADGIVSGLPSGQIRIMQTVAGDALLLGNVTYNDFQILQQYFGATAGWDKGDFDYNNTVDFNDFKLLVQDFSSDSTVTAAQLNSMNAFAGSFGYKLVAHSGNIGFNLVAIPEPSSLALLMWITTLKFRRFRRVRCA